MKIVHLCTEDPAIGEKCEQCGKILNENTVHTADLDLWHNIADHADDYKEIVVNCAHPMIH